MAFRAPSLEPVAPEPAISLVTPSDHWPIRLRFALPLSDEDLEKLCAKNRELRIERTKQGELVIMPPTGTETGRKSFELAGQLSARVRQDGSVGKL